MLTIARRALTMTLTATCTMSPGYYTPPDGWVVTQIAFQGSYHNMLPPVKENPVTLRRTVYPGEPVQAPPGCTTEWRAGEEKAEPQTEEKKAQ